MNNSSKNYCVTSRFRPIALIACLAICASTGFAKSAYVLSDLGILPGKKESVSTAINNQGQVAGVSSAGDASTDTAFRYNGLSKLPMEDLGGKFAGSANRSLGINDSGDVVGDSTFSGKTPVRRAALFKDGSITDLGTLKNAGNFSQATGINALGQVVGFASAELDSDKGRAFIWTPATGMIDIGTLGGEHAQAFAINDSGFVTGNSDIASSSLLSPTRHAFLYQPFTTTMGAVKAMQDLGTLGGHHSYGLFLNAKSHVVGYSTIDKSDSRVHAFLFDGKMMHDLGSLWGTFGDANTDQSVALGINASDEVVGYSYIPSQQQNVVDPIDPPTSEPQQVAFISRQGVMIDLNLLIGEASKRYLLQSATAINDRGQIAATAWDRADNTFHAVLLTPITNTK